MDINSAIAMISAHLMYFREDVINIQGRWMPTPPHFAEDIFAGAARRAGPDSMLILCVCVCVSEIISRPLIGRKWATLLGIIRPSWTRRLLMCMNSMKETYLLQQKTRQIMKG